MVLWVQNPRTSFRHPCLPVSLQPKTLASSSLSQPTKANYHSGPRAQWHASLIYGTQFSQMAACEASPICVSLPLLMSEFQANSQ